MSLFAELKRRHVFRVAIAYLAVAWLVLQVANIVSPILELPPVFERGVLVALAIGFPIALVFAWALELTPDGIRRETKSDHGSAPNSTSRRLNAVIIGVLSIAVTLFALDRFVWNETGPPREITTDGQQKIAVLPFVNMSDDPQQEYFSDGLSEELLNLLAQIPELRVTSRTSAFSFKDKDVTIPEVGRALGVDHVLEGSVRRSGDKIRITAQLIEVTQDAHVWSDTWDRDFSDVFAIQDEIAASVVEALKMRLLDEVPRAIETTPEAYELYLRAGFLMEQSTPSSYRQAEAINRQVLDIDPSFAPAWTQRANIYMTGVSFGAWESAEATPLAREAASQAVSLFGESAWAHAILARIAISHDFDYDIAAREKPALDRVEGLGRGYQLQRLRLQPHGETFFYVAAASHIDDSLQPFAWYKAYVVEGARFHGLPSAYIGALEQAAAIADPDPARQRDNIRLLWRLSR